MSNTLRFEYVSRPFGRQMTYAVHWLILANVAVFVGQLLLDVPLGEVVSSGRVRMVARPPGGALVSEVLALRPSQFLRWHLWQPFTYMFLHAGLWHMTMNMVCLFFFGPDVERALSTRQFFRFYILCGAVGVMGTVAAYAAGPGYPVSVVGASGACLGVLVACAVLEPHRQVFLLPFPVPIPMWLLVAFIIVMNLMSGAASGLAIWTHFGGMATGYLYMKLTPRLNAWWNGLGGRGKKPASRDEKLGEVIDGIFKPRDKHR